jgi:spore coat polysaccharide biosynthesis protein SpsF
MTDRAVAVIQARMSSTRLPGKVMLPLAGLPVLAHVVARARLIEGLDTICVAIPDSGDQQALVDYVDSEPDVVLAVGPEQDVLRRYVIAAEKTNADTVLRITSDCPLFDPAIAGAVLGAAARTGGYVRTAFTSGVPLGFDVEAASVGLLNVADLEAIDPYQREHVTPFIWQQPERFSAIFIDRLPDLRSWRLTLDEPEDYELMQCLFEVHGANDPAFGLLKIERLLTDHPELLQINAGVAATPIQVAMECPA